MELKDTHILWLGIGVGIVVGGIFGLTATHTLNTLVRGFSRLDLSTSQVGVLSSVILAVITGVYVIYTGNLVEETKMARQQEVKPVLNLTTAGYALGASGPKIENIGNGPAQNVQVEVSLEPEGPEQSIRIKTLPKGDFAGYRKPGITTEAREEFKRLRISGTCEDIFSNEQDISQEIELSVQRNRVDHLMERDKRSDELTKIRKNLGDVANNVEVDGVERYLSMKINQPILQTIEEQGPLTLRELSKELGILPRDLGRSVMAMRLNEVVDYDVPPKDLLKPGNEDVEIRVN